MSRALRVEPEALDELDAAVAWYDAKLPGLGGELLAEVHATFTALAAGTLPSIPAGRASNRVPIRRVLLERFPYAVVFIEHDEAVRVVAVAHHKRRPGYWRRRVRAR